MKVIFEDEKMIVVEKDPGELTQSGKVSEPNLISRLQVMRKQRKEPPFIAVLNRLDRPVGGLVLFAKDSKTTARLTEQMKAGRIHKTYETWVMKVGNTATEAEAGRLEDFLLKDGRTNKSAVVPEGTKDAKKAILEYKVLKRAHDAAGHELLLLRIHLLTGRHHQIRAQLSSRGFVILGDSKYLDDARKSGADASQSAGTSNARGEVKQSAGASDAGMPGIPQLRRGQIALYSVELTIGEGTKQERSFNIKWDGENWTF